MLILGIEKLCKRICKGDDYLHGLLFSRVKAHHESKGSVDVVFEARRWRTRKKKEFAYTFMGDSYLSEILNSVL